MSSALARMAANPAAVIHAAFATAALLLALLCWSLYVSGRQAANAADWVVRTEEALQEVASARESFALAESARRGYLLTRDDGYLSDRAGSLAKLADSVRRLSQLTVGNPAQQRRTAELAAAVAQRAALPLEALTGGQGDKDLLGAIEVGRAARARIDLLAEVIEREERNLLLARQVELREQGQDALRMLIAAFISALALLVPGYGMALLQARRRERAERRVTDLVENLPVTAWQLRSGTDGRREFVYIAPNASAVRGIDSALALGGTRVVLDSIVDDDRESVKAAMHESERKLQPFDQRYRVRTPDGATRWVHSRAGLKRVPGGDVVWSGYWADVTEQQAIERALVDATEAAQAANRAKSVFLATMSHEIRTPMTGVLGLLELLSLTPLDAEQGATLAVVRESGLSLLRIIDDILDFSKVEAGRLELSPVPSSLADAVRRSCEIHRGIASSRGLTLEHAIDPRVGAVLRFDPLRVGQILNNFISNAVKFTPQGGVRVVAMLLESGEGGQRVQLSVADTGVGVSPAAMSGLFQPFAQGGADTAGNYGGTGLGLAICRRLAELMGGTVEMESKPGEGTTVRFTATFPEVTAAADQPVIEQAPDGAHEAVVGRPMPPGIAQAEEEGTLVLVVDDHPTNRMVLTRQLHTLGYAFETAQDGEEALAIWRSRRVGLVLTDCNMPKLDGYDLARAIRRAEAEQGSRRVPILACTANALETEAARCLEAGMDDLLVKPVQLADMLRRLDKWLPLVTSRTEEPRPAPAEPAQGHGLVDHKMVDLISAGDKAVAQAVLADFRSVNSSDAQVLKDALRAGDDIELVHAAHRMRGACQMIGAVGVAAVCQRIERAGRAGDVDAARRELPMLEQELRRLDDYLGALADAARDARASAPPDPKTLLAGRHVLLVEDHDFQARGLVRMLNSAGAASVHAARDGAQALEILRIGTPVDLVITDLAMPGMDGVEFVRSLGARRPLLPVILASSVAPRMLHSVAHMLANYPVRLLGVASKPLTLEKLAPMLAHGSSSPVGEVEIPRAAE